MCEQIAVSSATLSEAEKGGQRESVSTTPSSFYAIQRMWQDDGVRFLPLHKVCDEPYTVYSPIRGQRGCVYG